MTYEILSGVAVLVWPSYLTQNLMVHLCYSYREQMIQPVKPQT